MVESERLLKALQTVAIKAKGEVMYRQNDPAQCGATRDALAKALYERTFGWLVDRIEMLLAPAADVTLGSGGSVAVLDIFGFEDFDQNR